MCSVHRTFQFRGLGEEDIVLQVDVHVGIILQLVQRAVEQGVARAGVARQGVALGLSLIHISEPTRPY